MSPHTWAVAAGRAQRCRAGFDRGLGRGSPVQIAAPAAVEPADGDRPGQGAPARPVRAARASSPRGRPGPTRAQPEVDPERLGVVVATGIGGITSMLTRYDLLEEKAAGSACPRTPSRCSCRTARPAWIGLELGARAGVHTTVSACASGAEAIGYAAGHDPRRPRRRGRGRRHRGGHPPAAHRARSPRCGRCPPATTSPSGPPARSTRAGTASCSARARASWCSSREEHAAARGARRVRDLAGRRLHLRRPPHRPARPGGQGRHRAIGRALTDADVAADIVHVNAHATSTPAGRHGRGPGDRGRARRRRRTGSWCRRPSR